MIQARSRPPDAGMRSTKQLLHTVAVAVAVVAGWEIYKKKTQS